MYCSISLSDYSVKPTLEPFQESKSAPAFSGDRVDSIIIGLPINPDLTIAEPTHDNEEPYRTAVMADEKCTRDVQNYPRLFPFSNVSVAPYVFL